MKQEKRSKRHIRVRKKVSGTKGIPRLSVYKSNRYIYAQIIDDSDGKTLVSSQSQKKSKIKTNKLEYAFNIGQKLAEKAKIKKIKKVVFDRSGYKYHGRVKSLAEGARKGGLVF